MQVIENGLTLLKVGVIRVNDNPSRTHGIIQIKIKDSNFKDFGKILLIDLAGRERVADIIDVNKQIK